jgi:hypothetical protein
VNALDQLLEEESARETEILEGNLPQLHFVHDTSRNLPRKEPGPQL